MPGPADSGSQGEPQPGPGAGVRLQKLLAGAGFGSRRGVEALLRDGRVTVNGRVAQLGERADPDRDRVAVDGEPLAREALEYWALHKPRGVLTSLRDPHGRRTVVELLPPGRPRLYPVGRLDLDTEGLVLMTNDGDLAQALLHPSLGNEREYQVVVRGALDERDLERVRDGVRLEDGPTAPARVSRVEWDEETGRTSLRLVLREGRKRQIRRTFQALGHPVKRLTRVRLGPLRLAGLSRGQARRLLPEEVKTLRAHARRLRAAASRGAGGRSA